jgi:hypothetical protein
MRDFHIYAAMDSAGGYMSAIMDPNDPIKADILKSMSQVFHRAGRLREASECLHAIAWRTE